MEGTHEDDATGTPRVGIDVPADGSMHLLPAPQCDGSSECRAIEHLDGCYGAAKAAWDAAHESDQVELGIGVDADVIGAIRMARLAAADDASALKLIDRLLTYAPDTHPRAIAPTRLLLDAVTELNARMTVPEPF